MNILVTGANGYIGSKVVKELLNSGCAVTSVLLRGETPHDCLQGSNLIYANILDENIDLSGYDAILHLAWKAGFEHNHPSHIADVLKHYEFIKRCSDAGIKLISVAGTMHEIGYHIGPINANTPCNPLNPYGIAKNFLRQALLSSSFKSDFELQWLRFYYITGDDERSQSIFGKIHQADKSGSLTFPLNSGEMLYDFIDVNELAKKISSRLLNFKAGIYNCSSGKPKSLRTRVEEYIKDNELSIRPEYGVFPERPYDSMAIWGEVEAE